jgi:toxin ParE1/3/4
VKILWSPQGRRDLWDIYRHIASDNPRAARALHDKILSGIQVLSEAPQMGRPGRVPGTREWVVAGTSDIVPHRVCGETLQILRVYHTSRLWPEYFE